jgi:hypothetical protein
MAKIRALKDASILDAPKPTPRSPSPAAVAREAEYGRLRSMIAKLTDPSRVYEVALEANEKALTVRQRLLKIAAESGKEIVVRRYGKGFAVGLLTPERRSGRGRRRKTPPQA